MDDATERSRLLDNECGHTNGTIQENGYVGNQHEYDKDGVRLAKEASTGELLLIMSGTWLGVFFSALGT
jgi:hypothetical protein